MSEHSCFPNEHYYSSGFLLGNRQGACHADWLVCFLPKPDREQSPQKSSGGVSGLGESLWSWISTLLYPHNRNPIVSVPFCFQKYRADFTWQCPLKLSCFAFFKLAFEFFIYRFAKQDLIWKDKTYKLDSDHADVTVMIHVGPDHLIWANYIWHQTVGAVVSFNHLLCHSYPRAEWEPIWSLSGCSNLHLAAHDPSRLFQQLEICLSYCRIPFTWGPGMRVAQEPHEHVSISSNQSKGARFIGFTAAFSLLDQHPESRPLYLDLVQYFSLGGLPHPEGL